MRFLSISKISMPTTCGRVLMRLRSSILLAAFSIGLLAALAAAHGFQSNPQHRNPEAEKLKNPIAGDAASIEEGKRLYGRHCSSCHGPAGKGDGGMALSGGTPANLTDETWDHGSTDGEIFVVIRDGTSTDMESYKEKLTEKQIWHLVNFIR